jgi:cytidyltransferase-like protein
MNVYVDGVFDLFHEGHVNFLKTAAGYGTLIVGVHSDAYVAGYKRKPVIPEKTRYEVVEACRYVDHVIRGAEKLTDEMIDEYKIDLVLHGDDFSVEDSLKHFKAAVERGIYRTIAYTKGVSSTKIIGQIEKRFSR